MQWQVAPLNSALFCFFNCDFFLDFITETELPVTEIYPSSLEKKADWIWIKSSGAFFWPSNRTRRTAPGRRGERVVIRATLIQLVLRLLLANVWSQGQMGLRPDKQRENQRHLYRDLSLPQHTGSSCCTWTVFLAEKRGRTPAGQG